MEPTPPPKTSLAYRFEYIEPDLVSLQDVSAAFYDLSVLYDIVALTAIPEGESVNFQGPWFRTRTGRPLPAPLRVYVLSARYESPLALELMLLRAIAKAPDVVRRWTAAIEDVFDLPDRIADRRGERRERRRIRRAETDARLSQLELEEAHRQYVLREIEIAAAEQQQRWIVTNADLVKLQREVGKALDDPGSARRELQKGLDQQGATRAYQNTKRRLKESPVQPTRAEVFEWEDAPPDEPRNHP
jgi:hypothetical protein